MSKVIFNSAERIAKRKAQRAEREAKMRYVVEIGYSYWCDEYCTDSLLWARIYGRFWSFVYQEPYRIIDRQAE